MNTDTSLKTTQGQLSSPRSPPARQPHRPLDSLYFYKQSYPPKLLPKLILARILTLAESQSLTILEHDIDEAILMKDSSRTSWFGFFGLNCLPHEASVIKVKVRLARPEYKTELVVKQTKGDILIAQKLVDRWTLIANDLLNELGQERLQDQDNGMTSPFDLQVSAYSHYLSIFQNINYSVGQQLSSFLGKERDFLGMSQTEVKTFLKQMFKLKHSLLAVLTDPNNTSKSVADFLPYSQASIDKYMWNKLHTPLLMNYRRRLDQSLKQFCTKQQRMLESRSIGQIYKQFDLPQALFNLSKTNLSEKLSITDRSKKLPYARACEQLEKMLHCDSFLQALRCIQMHFVRMKESAYESGKFTLQKMDDILPLTVLTVMLCDPEVTVELALVRDILSFEKERDWQKRLVMNLHSAVEFIINELDL